MHHHRHDEEVERKAEATIRQVQAPASFSSMAAVIVLTVAPARAPVDVASKGAVAALGHLDLGAKTMSRTDLTLLQSPAMTDRKLLQSSVESAGAFFNFGGIIIPEDEDMRQQQLERSFKMSGRSPALVRNRASSRYTDVQSAAPAGAGAKLGYSGSGPSVTDMSLSLGALISITSEQFAGNVKVSAIAGSSYIVVATSVTVICSLILVVLFIIFSLCVYSSYIYICVCVCVCMYSSDVYFFRVPFRLSQVALGFVMSLREGERRLDVPVPISIGVDTGTVHVGSIVNGSGVGTHMSFAVGEPVGAAMELAHLNAALTVDHRTFVTEAVMQEDSLNANSRFVFTRRKPATATERAVWSVEW